MKKQTWSIFVLVGALLASAASLGQTNRGELTASIPFSFIVGNNTLPAGRYTISPVSDVILRIDSASHQSAFTLTGKVHGKAPESSGRMVFHRYGDVYFLTEVWVAANSTGRKIFESRAEKEAAGRATGKEIAVLRIVQ